MAKTLSSQTLKKNDNAPSFRLMGTDNKFYSLEDFKVPVDSFYLQSLSLR